MLVFLTCISVYVGANAFLSNAVVSSTYEKFKLRLLNQKNSNHVEKICKRTLLFHFEMEDIRKQANILKFF